MRYVSYEQYRQFASFDYSWLHSRHTIGEDVVQGVDSVRLKVLSFHGQSGAESITITITSSLI